jgi:hypothetical protein
VCSSDLSNVNLIEVAFGISLGDYYRTYIAIKSRKKSELSSSKCLSTAWQNVWMKTTEYKSHLFFVPLLWNIELNKKAEQDSA